MDKDMLIHPGEILKEEFLEPHGLNANQLAVRLGVPPNAITAIINGQRGITGPMSMLLGHAFGMSEDFFAHLQTRYELDLATIDATSNQKSAERLRRADALARELKVA
ncbi:MAG TPA: HigA family addiction module antitoxin [Rhodopila sp.]|nr:HigA family addiction module antitoxin [Rhodopila sp.]